MPQPFSLSLDVAGPLKTKGRSMGLVDEDQLKYMLVGAYRVPKCLLTSGDLPVEEEGLDKLDKDDPLEYDEDLADISPSEPEGMRTLGFRTRLRYQILWLKRRRRRTPSMKRLRSSPRRLSW